MAGKITEQELGSLLGIRINNIETESLKVVNKADKTYVDTQIQAVASGSPKGVYATTGALASAFPTGNSNIYLVNADGHWYYWNGSAWTDGGTYQATGLADNAVSDVKISDVQLTKVENTRVKLGDATKWGSVANGLTTNDNLLTYNKTQVGDSGVQFLVDLTGVTYDTVTIKFKLARTVNNPIDGALFTMAGVYVVGGIVAGNYSTGYNTFTLTKTQLTSYSLEDGFRFIVACHVATFDFTLSEFSININGLEYTLEETLKAIKTKSEETIQTVRIAANAVTATQIATNAVTDTKILAGAVTLEKMATGVLVDDNISTGSGTYGSFPSTFSSITKTIQGDGSILCISTNGTSDPSIQSGNINTNNKCKIGNVLKVRFRAKATHAGGRFRIDTYRPDTYATTVSAVEATLGLEYTTYEFKVNCTADVPDGTNVYIIVKIRPVIINQGFQYTEAIWMWDDEGDFPLPLNEKLTAIESQVGDIAEQRLGQMIDMTDATRFVKVSLTGYHLITPQATSNSDDNIIKTIGVFAETAGDCDFVIGTIDQYNLVVSSDTFTLTLAEGYQEVDLEAEGYRVSYGAQLFMDISTVNILYTASPTSLKYNTVLAQDESQTINEVGYSGMIMHGTTYMIPFGYVLQTQPLAQRIDTLALDVAEVKATVAGFAQTEGDILLIQPDGTKRTVKVDSTGGLVLGYYYPRKVAVLGNSLTAGFSDLPSGTFGMAASSPTSDYFYKVKAYLEGFYPTLEMLRLGGYGWESLTTSQSRIDWWNNTMSASFPVDTDLVIIQLVDNVNTAEKEATFAVDAKTLIENIRIRCPKAKVLWVAGWYVSTWEIEAIQIACTEKGAIFCDITPYKSDAQYKSVLGATITRTNGSTFLVDNSGVASHPGDLGMTKIADVIKATLNLT